MVKDLAHDLLAIWGSVVVQQKSVKERTKLVTPLTSKKEKVKLESMKLDLTAFMTRQRLYCMSITSLSSLVTNLSFLLAVDVIQCLQASQQHLRHIER